MGAALLIPILVIVLAAVAYLLWTLYAAGRGAASIVKDDTTGETAAHYDQNHNVSTKPPGRQGPEGRRTEGGSGSSR